MKAAPVRGTPPHGYVATPSMEVFACKVHLKKGYVWPELKASANKYGQSALTQYQIRLQLRVLQLGLATTHCA